MKLKHRKVRSVEHYHPVLAEEPVRMIRMEGMPRCANMVGMDREEKIRYLTARLNAPDMAG